MLEHVILGAMLMVLGGYLAVALHILRQISEESAAVLMMSKTALEMASKILERMQ